MKIERQRHIHKITDHHHGVSSQLTLYTINSLVRCICMTFSLNCPYPAPTVNFRSSFPIATAKRNNGFGDVPNHIEKGLTLEVEGGSGAAERRWGRCEETTVYGGE